LRAGAGGLRITLVVRRGGPLVSPSNAVRLLGLVVLIGLLLAPVAVSDQGDDPQVDLTLVSGNREVTNSLGMRFAPIPAGTFAMGAPKADKLANSHELPQHDVQLTKSFYLGVFEVTQKQYKEVMGTNPSGFSRTGTEREKVKDVKDRDLDDFPVDNVSWDEAQEFCKKLTALDAEKRAGRTYRLPTEAEWEYCCRAGTKTAYHTGDGIAAKEANFANKLGRTCKVGSYKPNAFGLYDMHGNVWEWVQDEWDANYYGVSPKADPKGPGGMSVKVHRGGCYNAPDRECRSSHRTCSTHSVKDGRFGFRVALTMPRRD
jgi:formylglycine-generating enzyme required for sulfatase activity